MKTGGLSFKIFVMATTIQEIIEKGEPPNELHGYAQPRNGNVFELNCPFDIWMPSLASTGGDMHLRRRPATKPLSDE